MISISVVIPTYNRINVLKKVLAALIAQHSKESEFEVVVVDDGSSDGTEEYFRCSILPEWIRYFRNKSNSGRVVTRNNGIHYCSGNAVIFLDDDNIPSPQFVAAYRSCFLSEGGGTAFIGAPSYPIDDENRSNLVRYLNSRYFGNRVKYSPLAVSPANFGTLNCAVWKEDLLRVGCFDTDFRYYGGEDEYMGYCLKRSGVTLKFCAEAKSLHIDVVSFDRYRLKIEESIVFGSKLIRKKAPDYYKETKLHFVFNERSDLIRRFLISPIAILCASSLECFLKRTDHLSQLYLPLLIRGLILFWALKAVSKESHTVFVKYPPEE